MKRTELISKIIKNSKFTFQILLTKSKNDLEELYKNIDKVEKQIKIKPDKRFIRNQTYNKAKKLGLKVNYNDNIDEMKKLISIQEEINKNDDNRLEKEIDDAIALIKTNKFSIGKTKKLILNVNNTFYTVTLSNYRRIIEELNNLKINLFMQEYEYDDYDQDPEPPVDSLDAIASNSVNTSGSSSSVSVSLSSMNIGRGGNFFPYLNNSKYNLTHCGIYDSFDPNNYKISCFHKCLQESKLFTEIDINRIKHLIINEYIPKNRLNQIAKELQISITLQHRITNRNDMVYKYYNKGQRDTLKIGLIHEHYFINNNGEFEIIEKIFKKNEFVAIPDSHEIYNTIFVDNIINNQKLEYSWKSCKKIETNSINNLNHYDNIFYADYEATTDGINHESYMVCLVDDNNIKKAFTMKNHTINFLDYLKTQKGNFITYFHNLGYDYQFFIKYVTVINIIKTGSTVKQINCKYKGTKLCFRDSYSLIPAKLDNFNKMFGIQSKKTYLPHELFNTFNLDNLNGFIPIIEALKNIPKEHHEDINKYEIDGEINLYEYAKDYCLMDCIVLRDGLNTFKKNILPLFKMNGLSDNTNLDIINSSISTPSLVYKIMKNDQKNIDNLYSFSHNIQKYLANFVVGGRVMCNSNKKQYIKNNKQISSLDANSLYPSAFIRIKEIGGFLMGKPKILKDKTMQFLNTVDGYFVRIKITKINKSKPFPILSIKNKTGIRNFTNDIEGEIISVDKFTLEDAIIHHDIEYEIIDGYYFNEGRNPAMCDLVEELYAARLKLKAEKNPLENIYKLLLNSLYGKFIESDKNKLIQLDIIKDDKYEKFINNNYNRIKEYSKIGKDYKNNDVYLFKSKKIINKHFNCQQIGIEILSMSKRIMNEVFEIADNNNIEIFYQDTDSLKMYTEDVNKLSNAYFEKYNKNLLGKELGQFKDEYEKIYCDVFIAVAKKFYYSNDIINNDDKISCKGIPLTLLKKYTNKDGKLIKPEQLFTDLYNGEKVTFSNTNFDKVMFKHNKDLTISNNTSFNRTVKFKD